MCAEPNDPYGEPGVPTYDESLPFDVACPNPVCTKWSDWTTYSACSKQCNGGIRTKTRKCLSGNEERPDEECPDGVSLVEGSCNTQACEKEMKYWNNKNPARGFEEFTEANTTSEFFKNLNGNTTEEKCASFCLFNECLAMEVSYFNIVPAEVHCFISLVDPFDEPGNTLNCYGTMCLENPNNIRTNTFGIFEENAAHPENLPTDLPDGSYLVSYEDVNGLCEKNRDSNFGEVDYRQTPNYEYQTDPEKNIIQEPIVDENDCKALCFEKAGCASFFVNNNNCNMIIGATNAVENNNIEVSGRLTNVCPNSAFTNDYNRRSEFYCRIDLKDSDPASSINQSDIDAILSWNNINYPLQQWNFESNNAFPLITKSNYVAISFLSEFQRIEAGLSLLDPSWGYRWFKFTFETHVRQQQIPNDNKRRSTSSNEALEELIRVEESAISFIMTSLVLPRNFSVGITSPVVNIYSRQVSPDGAIAADCSSGFCKCAQGFIDNGNGCVEMSDEQTEQIWGCNPFSFSCENNILKVINIIIQICFCSISSN